MKYFLLLLVGSLAAFAKGDTYNCAERNPCTDENIAAGNFYFASDDPHYFVQCDAHGGCFVMPCGPGTVWDQEHLTCAHAPDDNEPACTDGPVETDIVCENRGWAVLACAQGSNIRVQSANYGRTQPSREVCRYYWFHADKTDCVSDTSEQQVKDKCEGKQACMVPSSSLYFGDPCPFTYKYLSITYQCVCDVPDTYDCDDLNPCNAETIEENGGYYFPHHEETNFVQCDAHGGCFVMNCGEGTKWDQDAYTCVHA